MNYYLYVPLFILLIFLLLAFYKRYQMMKSIGNEPESDKLHILSDANFNKQISSGVSLVDFWAPWCGPCRILGPTISQLADELGDHAKICKLNIDENKKMAGQLSVRSIPTLILFKDGEPIKRFVGVKTKAVYLKAIQEVL